MKKITKLLLLASVAAAGVGIVNKVVGKKNYAKVKRCCCSDNY